MMDWAFVLLALGATLGTGGVRRKAALAAVAVGLALAGLRAAGDAVAAPFGMGTLHHPALPPAFLAADAALLAAGAVLAILGGAVAIRQRRPARLAGVALLGGAAAALWTGRPLLASAQPGAAAASLAVILGAGAAALAVGRAVALGADGGREGPAPLDGVIGVVAGTLAVGLGPHLAVVVLGAIVASLAGYRLQRAREGPLGPLIPLAALLLLPIYWLTATIAGPEGLGMASLGDLPFSPAAERLLAPALLLVGWAMTGLWPLHRHGRGVLLAPAGLLVVARVALPAWPDGVEHWRALAVPLIVAGLWQAVLSRGWSRAAAALAWIGLLGSGACGVAAVALPMAGALALELGAPGGIARRAAGAMTAVGALFAVERGLGVEVVYTVAAVLAVVAGVGRESAGQAMTPSAPRAMAPSA